MLPPAIFGTANEEYILGFCRWLLLLLLWFSRFYLKSVPSALLSIGIINEDEKIVLLAYTSPKGTVRGPSWISTLLTILIWGRPSSMASFFELGVPGGSLCKWDYDGTIEAVSRLVFLKFTSSSSALYSSTFKAFSVMTSSVGLLECIIFIIFSFCRRTILF